MDRGTYRVEGNDEMASEGDGEESWRELEDVGGNIRYIERDRNSRLVPVTFRAGF
jgi:hypothetical protein